MKISGTESAAELFLMFGNDQEIMFYEMFKTLRQRKTPAIDTKKNMLSVSKPITKFKKVRQHGPLIWYKCSQ